MIRDALTFIDPNDRDLWVTMAMAVKNAEGESGFQTWNSWSALSPRYRERDARAVWRSVKPHGGVTVKTLYKLAMEAGYKGDERFPPPPRNYAAEIREQKIAERKRRVDASRLARDMIMRASPGPHEYLAAKGFPNATGFVLNGELLVPMWNMDAYGKRLNSVQRIKPDGTKLFLSGGQVKWSIFAIGSGPDTILCEGYATALSVKAAVDHLYMRARVVACFSAHNLTHVAKHTRGRAFIVADNDQSGTGQNAAASSDLPWWMPPDVGHDANDYHQARGVAALASAINTLRRERGPHRL